MNVEYVRWHDACYDTEEKAHSELGGLIELHEIGFLIKETAESVVLCIEYQKDSASSRLTLTIPKINIVERVPINLSRFLAQRKRKDKRNVAVPAHKAPAVAPVGPAAAH